jgi:hypothetical protein
MASGYPGTLDALATNRTDATTSATTHAADHNNANDAINKIEAELGTDPAGTAATVVARLDTLVASADLDDAVVTTQAAYTALATPRPPRRVYFCTATATVTELITDDFTRTLSNALGSADTGQAWAINQTATKFAVNGNAATFTHPAGNDDISATIDINTRDIGALTRWSGSALPTASALSIFLLLRYTSGTNTYRAKVAVGTTGAMTLTWEKYTTTTAAAVAIGSAVTLAETFSTANQYWVRAETVGNGTTTTLRARAWQVGNAEPSTWHTTQTDTDTNVQGATDVGIYSRAGTGMTPVPYTTSWHEYHAYPAT